MSSRRSRWKLSRGVALIESSSLSQPLADRDVELLRNVIDGFETSLQIVDYLPESYQRKRDSAQHGLHGWADRFLKECLVNSTGRQMRHSGAKDPSESSPYPKTSGRRVLRLGGVTDS